MLWCFAALVLGGFVKGVVGIGLPMIAVPLMSLAIPPYVAAAMMIIPILPANAIQVRGGPPFKEKLTRFWPLVVGIGIGTFAGGWFFLRSDPKLLQLVVGAIVLVYALQRMRTTPFTVPEKVQGTAGFGVGAVAGALGGMAMLIGPMTVMYMSSLKLNREDFVGCIAFVYLTTTATVGLALASFDKFTTNVIIASVAACIPAVLGVFIGSRCRKYISQTLFDKLLTALIATIAVSLFVRALT